MPIDIVHPFTGETVAACSYTSQFISKHAEAAKAIGMTEAQYEKHLVQGQWGVYKGKMATDELKSGDVLFRMEKNTGPGNWTASWGENHKINVVEKGSNKKGFGWSPEDFEKYWLNHPAYDFKLPGAPGPAVSPGSKAVGALTDQDAATLFVKVKDDFAKMQGVAIKGANTALDMEVYASIGGKVGYSAKELAAKVERYKANGNKLSALKKKVLKDESLVEKAWAKKAASLPDPPAIPTTSSVHAPSPTSHTAPGEPPKVTTHVSTDPPPAATLEATQQTAEQALADLKAKQEAKAIVYTDEDIAKAYIKAKDELASSTENPWTLYTQKNKQFEDAIANLMEKSYGIELPFNKIQQQVASYLGDGNKLSVLKKKMAKTGEHKPLADTLKKSKAEKALSSGTTDSAAAAAEQVDIIASAQASPAGGLGSKLKGPIKADSAQEDFIFFKLKDKVYKSMSDKTVYDTLSDYIKTTYVQANSVKPSVLQLVRAYDRKKAAQLGIENGFYYEKRLANWAASPEGKTYLLDKQTAEELLAKRPPLPTSSNGYPLETTLSEATRIQRDMGSWNASEKDGLRHYTGGAHSEMNMHLRKGFSISGQGRLAVNKAQKGMRATTEKMFARRGCSWSQFEFGNIDEAIKAVGTKIFDKGFLSTSVGPAAAFGGQVMLEVEVAQGTAGAYIKSISKFAHENELLIARNTEYEILSVTPPAYAYGPTTIRVRTVPGSHAKGSI